ncbi:MAG: RluA family pseudouridine synthase [Alphaproteobacteria bacterium]|nr:RluA family pseudouridine synthase [Alphaproteobacteria bacterium]
MEDEAPRHRELEVPAAADGMRLDRFLALRFRDRSRSELARAIKAGEVTDPSGRALRASALVRTGEVLHLYVEGIAPGAPPPPFPAILHEDDRVVVVDKPPGLMAHPAGTRFVYALVGLARARWPELAVDLVHRLDKDTSGVVALTKDVAANAFLKARLKAGEGRKEYLAIVKGRPDWDALEIDAPIGRADGPIRIQMAVRPDGLPSRTGAEVVAHHPTADLALVRCRLHTGRTHQIRVHLAHVGFPLLGDLLYGVPPEVFLTHLDHGLTPEVLAAAGAPRHALHAHHLVLPHPDGGLIDVRSPLAADLEAWWADPSLPARG